MWLNIRIPNWQFFLILKKISHVLAYILSDRKKGEKFNSRLSFFRNKFFVISWLQFRKYIRHSRVLSVQERRLRIRRQFQNPQN